ncbi:MAG: competence/damage-inducible protein A [Ilumatobacteraceae bacterium]|jgi:nicotinamide-nucleotide amidase|nr:competence/damage-inducible protein A [Ilumatobacteraceae bacterium]
MRCNVVAVGTELLLGQIVDTNSSYIGEQLAAVGIASHLQLKVGDNLDRVVEAFTIALKDADAIIVCGGLGPTHDDLTRDAIARMMGVELLHDEAVAAVIEEMFSRRGRRMSANNLRQAMVPVGARIIEQTRGTAPGLMCPVGNKMIYAVPGVPHEMQDMLSRAVLPDLLARSGEKAVISSRVLRTWGESESGLNERLDPIIEELEEVGNPTLAFLASGWEGIKVRLTAKADSQLEADELLSQWETKVRALVGDVVFGVDAENMESVVLGLLQERGWTLGVAESVTGGLVGGRLTSIPGSSAVFRGGVISYASDVKFEVLGVDRGPVVSEEAAVQMAVGAKRVIGSDVAIALTGVAGPDEQDGRPAGTLCIGVALPDGATFSTTNTLPGLRDQMRQYSVISALSFLRGILLNTHR